MPSGLVPSWLLWTPPFWENYVNLHIDAPYTEKFLAAPLFVAGAKFALIAGLAWGLHKIAQKYWATSSDCLRDLMTCWFLSSFTMSVYHFAISLIPVTNGGAFPDPVLLALSGLSMPVTWENFFGVAAAFMLYTLIFLALAFVLYFATGFFTQHVVTRFGTTIDGWQGHLTAQSRLTALCLAAISYVVFNGFFAALIRF